MNISPTPKRYHSSRNNMTGNYRSDPLMFDDFNGNEMNSNYPKGMKVNDRIVPEEYKLNSQMINRLIKQNKDLTNRLTAKQDEINRLNSLVGSLRGKLIKYTELNKKMNESLRNNQHADEDMRNNSSSSGIIENINDYIQVPKRRTNNDAVPENVSTPNVIKTSSSYDQKIASLSEKLDKLTNLVSERKQQQDSFDNNGNNRSYSGGNRVISPTSAIFMQDPSDEDIMVKESSELKKMENQIEALKHKLLVKRENELRKISLNQELLELMDKLNLQNSEQAMSFGATEKPQRIVSSPTNYCNECHNSHHNKRSSIHGLHHHHENHDENEMYNYHEKEAYLKKPEIPSSNPLETPTPLNKR